MRALCFNDCDLQALTDLAREDPARYSEPVSALLHGMGSVPGIFDAIYQGVSGGYLDAGLRDALKEDLDGAGAQSERAQFIREKEASTEAENRRTQLRDWLENALNASEGGNPACWINLWQIIWEMDSGRWEGNPRIDESKGWKILDPTQRGRALEAASRFLLAPGDLNFNFIGERTHPIWATALYSALLLVWRERPGLLQGATGREWWLWTTSALWFPYGQKQDEWVQLMAFLSHGDPKAFLESVEFVVGEEIRGGESLAVFLRQRVQWPPELARVLLRAINSPETPLSAWSSSLEWGLVSFPDIFEELTIDKVFELASEFPFPPHREKLIAACCVLFRHGRGDPWKQLSDIFYARPSLNGDFFGQVGGLRPENAFLERMSDNSVAEFYIWVAREHPEGSENLPMGFGAVGPDFTTRALRDAAFFAMRDRGNLSVFDFVARSFPEKEWIEGHRPAAVEAALRRKWKARTPEALLRLMAERAIPWHQSKAAFVGAIVLPTIFSVLCGIVFGGFGSAWLRWCLCAVLAAALSGVTLFWIRLMRRPRFPHGNK